MHGIAVYGFVAGADARYPGQYIQDARFYGPKQTFVQFLKGSSLGPSPYPQPH